MSTNSAGRVNSQIGLGGRVAAGVLIVMGALAGGSVPQARTAVPSVSTGLGYVPPAVAVVTHAGLPTRLPALMDAERTVIVDFIFTSCQAICPVMSATFSQLERKLGAERDQVRLVSVSIDPETDTPAVLRVYATQFHAGPEWTFVTGAREDIITIQKAFGNYQRNKMEHVVVYFMRPPRAHDWVRIEGSATASDLFAQYQRAKGR